MSAKHLQRYVNVFAGRHNLRSAPTAAVARGLEGKRLKYCDLVK
jgi:hypothetical protein